MSQGSQRIPPAEAREAVRRLPTSQVRLIANAGFGRTDLLKFWFGEYRQPTPDYIKQAGMAALAADQTLYAPNLGREDLRAAIAGYVTGLHGAPMGPERITVTSSGVSALHIAMQALLDPGDRVVIVTPIWPNVAEIPRILGAQVERVGLRPEQGGWRLDLDALLDAITPQTRLVILNSPGNPTGWRLPAEHRAPILERCRRLGVWLMVDDVYERLVFDPGLNVAPSFLQIADPEDRLIGANSFSKAWLMTGWRLGWLVTPAALEADIGKLVEFNTSCAPDFVQLAGLAAITQGEPHVAALRRDLEARAAQLVARLSAMPGVEAPRPDGAMYVLFRIRGFDDSVALAHRLLAEAGLGLAPGAAFGSEAEGWLRWCFAATAESLDAGADALAGWLARQPS